MLLHAASERPAHLLFMITSASLSTSFEYTPSVWEKLSYSRKCRSEIYSEMPIHQYFSWQRFVLNITNISVVVTLVESRSCEHPERTGSPLTLLHCARCCYRAWFSHADG